MSTLASLFATMRETVRMCINATFAKDYIGRFKIQRKAAKSKALRKELKRKDSKKE